MQHSFSEKSIQFKKTKKTVYERKKKGNARNKTIVVGQDSLFVVRQKQKQYTLQLKGFVSKTKQY